METITERKSHQQAGHHQPPSREPEGCAVHQSWGDDGQEIHVYYRIGHPEQSPWCESVEEIQEVETGLLLEYREMEEETQERIWREIEEALVMG